jgi:hypothetical protein
LFRWLGRVAAPRHFPPTNRACAFDPGASSSSQRSPSPRGGKTRRKQAIVAVARKLLVRCWAMLRDGAPWRGDPTPAPAAAPA